MKDAMSADTMMEFMAFKAMLRANSGGIGAVLWNDSCRRFKQYEEEPKPVFGFISRFEWAEKKTIEEAIKREKIRLKGEDTE